MVATFVPRDEAQRQAVRSKLDENMLVEAGAGTGKTTVLVDRIVEMLKDPRFDVRHLAVITFTEKAAAELAGRVRRELEDARDATADDAVRERLDAALRGLNQAHIETIHAFASGLLRERPVEAGLDPGFEVLDELPAQLAFETAYDEWLTAEMAQDTPPQALIDVLNLDLQFNRVREAAEALHRHRDTLPLGPFPHVQLDHARVVDEIERHVEKLSELKSRIRPGYEWDEKYVQIAGIEQMLVNLRARREDSEGLRRAIVTAETPKNSRGKQEHWATVDIGRAVRLAIQGIIDELAEAKQAWRSTAVANMLGWLQGFAQEYERRRKAAGQADFDDLLIWARALVQDESVCAYFQDKYRHILVDEFQDTDPLQLEIIVRLCASSPRVDDWRRTPLRPGSLFVVGDPKQSIYRFRRADIAMYDTVKGKMFGGSPLTIVQNFRSVKPVIDWVNRTFEQLFEEEEGVQPRHIDLLDREDIDVEAGVDVIPVDMPAGEAKRPAVRTFEAELIASLVSTSVATGAWQARRADGTRTAAEFRDVVVVIPMRTDLQLYEDAFARAGVPYRHEGGRTFFLRQEVRELVAILRAIDDPADGVAAVAALRSSAFGCSDEELLLHRAAGGRFDYLRVRQDAAGPVAESMRVLRDLAKLRHEGPLSELVRAVLDRTRLVEFAMLQPQGDQVAANLLKVIDQARTFSEASGRGLRGFVRWLKENMTRVSDETDAPISEETDNVVRIVTIHSSKGLEFPVVVFANMMYGRSDALNRIIVDRQSNSLHIKLGKYDEGFRTPGFDAAERTEKHHRAAEDLRLLYVAATRAKDRLVVPLVTPPKSKNGENKHDDKSLNEQMRKAGVADRDLCDISGLPKIEGTLPVWARPHGEPAAEADVTALLEARAAWQTEHRALVGQASEPLVVRTATSFKPEWDRSSAQAEGVRRGSAADFGSAVHALLERIGLRAPDDLGERALALAKEFGQEGKESEIERVARRALDSACVARALKSRRMLLEVPFTAALPTDEVASHDLADGIAEGRIDLLFEEDGALVVADFKTDDVNGADIDRRAQHYRPQALVYAWASQRASGMPVREVVFIFARPGEERTFAVDAAFLAEADALMRSVPEREADPVD